MSYIHQSIAKGKVPTVAQLETAESRMGYNQADGLFYALKIKDGIKSVICIGGGGVVINPESDSTLSQRDSGGIVTWLHDLVFRITPCYYHIQGKAYTSPLTDVELQAADALNPRIDVIFVDIFGHVRVLKGFAEENPAKPLLDPLTQLELTHILLPANAVVPPDVNEEMVYRENEEWTGSVVTAAAGTVVFFTSGDAPYSGTKQVRIAKGLLTWGSIRIGFVKTGLLYNAQDSTLILSVRISKAIAATTAIVLTLKSYASQIGTPVTIKHGSYGFDRNVLTYQTLAIPFTAFNATASQLNTLQISFSGTVPSGAMFVDFDEIKFQNGIQPGITTELDPVFQRWLATNPLAGLGGWNFNSFDALAFTKTIAVNGGNTLIIQLGEYLKGTSITGGIKIDLDFDALKASLDYVYGAIKPVFTTPYTFNVAENTTNVGTIEAGNGVNFSLVTVDDYLLFDINPNTGVLTFKSAPDYEHPLDIGTNNIYNLTIRATNTGGSTDQTIAITVVNANEVPVITSSASFDSLEGQTAVGTVVATDPEGGSLSYGLNGADVALFNISSGGVITWKNAPVYGATNAYHITATVTDPLGLYTTQNITINVTANDAVKFISTWKTDNAGVSNTNQIKLPLVDSGTYNFIADWGDGTTSNITSWNQAETTHTFPTTGTKTIKIIGTCYGWAFLNAGDRLKILTVSNWGTGFRFGNTGGNFWGCSNFNITTTDAPDMTGTTTMANMFRVCSIFNQTLNSWNTGNITSLNSTFYGCSIFNQSLNSWDVSKVTNMTLAFAACTAFNGNIASWNTGAAITMPSVFYLCSNFNQNIGGWNVSNVTNMSAMFYGCLVFNQSLNSWNTIKVTDMNSLFYDCNVFNANIASWNTGAVINMNNIFNRCFNFNINISGWNTANVTNMASMFQSCHAFNQNIGGWNVGKVTLMNNMFYDATIFNQSLNSWDVSNVTNMYLMLGACSAFNGTVTGWNTISVTNMQLLFYSSPNFNQDLSAWNVANVTNMINMLLGSGVSIVNYSNALIGWATQAVKSNVQLDAGSIKYNSGATASRTHLTGTHGWTITDGGLQ